MNNIAKKARQIFTVLLMLSMLVGSMPVNAFAMEGIIPEMETVSEDILQLDDL